MAKLSKTRPQNMGGQQLFLGELCANAPAAIAAADDSVELRDVTKTLVSISDALYKSFPVDLRDAYDKKADQAVEEKLDQKETAIAKYEKLISDKTRKLQEELRNINNARTTVNVVRHL